MATVDECVAAIAMAEAERAARRARKPRTKDKRDFYRWLGWRRLRYRVLAENAACAESQRFSIGDAARSWRSAWFPF
jgi:hypothetical protein